MRLPNPIEMYISEDKLLPKFFATLTRNSTKNMRGNLGVGDIEGGASTASVMRVSGSRETSSYTLMIQSTLRIASDAAQSVLPGVGAVAGVIPVVGAPLQVAIGGLLFILQGIDRNLQNKQDIASLKLRLEELRICIDNAPNTTDPHEQARRKMLTRVLEVTSSKLVYLNKSSLRFTYRVTQAITRCSNEINNYLLLYSVAAQMQARPCPALSKIFVLIQALLMTMMVSMNTMMVILLTMNNGKTKTEGKKKLIEGSQTETPQTEITQTGTTQTVKMTTTTLAI